MKRFKGSKSRKFSLENAEYLCQEVQRMEETQMFYPSDFVEALRELAEVIIWSDKNVESVFDSFLERNMMATLERIVTNAEFPSMVKGQGIQCITMLLQNLTRKSSVYCICSNNHLNRIISITIDESDDELLSIYVSFLKTLALRLNEDTVQFFFESETGNFPLFDRASKLLDASDRIVRAAARQIVISVAQLNEPAITVFLESALKEVFHLIAVFLWSQIKNLGESAMEYAVIRPDNVPAPPLLSVASLSDRLEDVVDDLFYINDLFAVPHNFALPMLEHVLDEVVISPLVLSITASFKPYPSNSNSSSSSFLVPAPTAMFVLTRWLLINEIERLRGLFRERLLGSDPDGGPVYRVLKSGCMQSISGGILLLGAMVNTGFFVDKKGTENISTTTTTSTNTNNSTNSAAARVRTDTTSEEAGSAARKELSPLGKEELLLMDVVLEKWNIKGCVMDSFPPLQPWETPSCETFVNHMCQDLKDIKLRRWGECLVMAFYHLFTRGMFTRLSVFGLALCLLMDFIKHIERKNIILGGLLFLSLTLIRRRTIAYADYFALRKDGTDGNDLAAAAASSSALTSQEYLRSAYATLFLKLEHVCCGYDGVGGSGRSGGGLDWSGECDLEVLSREASLLLPLLPGEGAPHPNTNSKDNINSDDSITCEDNTSRYVDRQQRVAAIVPAVHRASHNRAEAERSELLMWMALRRCIFSEFKLPDGLLLRLKDYGVRHRPSTAVRVSLTARLCFRCELVKERYILQGSPPTAAAGTPMYLVLYETEALFLAAADSDKASSIDPAPPLRVMFAFQLIYVRAVVSQTPFSVIVTHGHPSVPLQLHLVFRSRWVAQSAVEAVMDLVKACRARGATVAYRALNPKSCKKLNAEGNSVVETKPSSDV
ncbi:CLEC16A/TT9 [Trypanosoma melophagium]|uniref:CLEC16A/TT9 n=1 Tax=Trypanosoma melophagium TaxID=715481 RepID=UPI00351A1951|nr:CLEC16A/TT9 [Trypanosoma melophagium]